MNWTEQDLKEYYDRLKKGGDAASPTTSSTTQGFSAAPVRASAGARSRHQTGRMNKLEAEYAGQLELQRLAGDITAWKFESYKLRLADRTWFTPDFAVMKMLASSHREALEFHECKAHWEDDARVKIKVAAEQYPEHRFIAVTKKKVKDGGGWKVEEFGR